MAAAPSGSVDDYIAAQPEAARASLRAVRAAIRSAIPEAEEVISYKIPAYRLPGGVVIFFAGWKKHYALYPATERVVSTLAKELAPYDVEKGTIRFPFGGSIPVALIARIAKLRAAEVAAGTKTRSPDASPAPD
jgi:uncharacterized protein YdhG (YjbR/CyaY superfamily)